MKSLFHLSAWLPAILTLGAHAQAHAIDPADPSSPAPLPAYHSAFDGYRKVPEPMPPSVQQWRTANDAAGGLNNHAGHAGMQHEQPEEKHENQHEHQHEGHKAHDMHSMHQHAEGASK